MQAVRHSAGTTPLKNALRPSVVTILRATPRADWRPACSSAPFVLLVRCAATALQPVPPAAQPPYAAGAMRGAPVQPPVSADGERERQQALFSVSTRPYLVDKEGIAELRRRLQDERARSAGFATSFATNFCTALTLAIHTIPASTWLQNTFQNM